MEGNVKLENDTEISYTNENLVGAFYEVNFKNEDGEYHPSEMSTDGGTEYTIVNGESHHIIFADGTVLGEDCVLQLVDTSVQENGSHTIRCADGSEIQVNIVKKESSSDAARETKTIKPVLPCNSSSVKTYPPSNKSSSINSDPALTEGDGSFSYFADISDRTEEQIKSETKNHLSCKSIKSVKPKPNVSSCPKCKRTFIKPHQLEWHCETFCGTKPFRCYTCNKRFSKDRFNYHVSICQIKLSKNTVSISQQISSSDSD